MAEGQIRKDLIKRADKNTAKPKPKEEEEREGLSPDKADIALDAAFAQMDSQDKAQDQVLADRRGIASGLKDLSKRGALTGDLLKDARQRATEAGVSESQFDTFLEGNRIRERGSPFSFKKAKTGTGLFDQPAPDPTASATSAPTESKEEAAQNVMFQRQYGTGLGTLTAMQDPNYELGSGSALRQPARSIGPASGKFRRAARRLRRQGYGDAAQNMAAAGELAHMNKPSIDTQALRGQRMLQKRAAGREASKQDKLAAGSKDIFDVVGVDKPDDRPNIEEKSETPYISTLDRTRNKGLFGATKRQGQRI